MFFFFPTIFEDQDPRMFKLLYVYIFTYFFFTEFLIFISCLLEEYSLQLSWSTLNFASICVYPSAEEIVIGLDRSNKSQTSIDGALDVALGVLFELAPIRGRPRQTRPGVYLPRTLIEYRTPRLQTALPISTPLSPPSSYALTV